MGRMIFDVACEMKVSSEYLNQLDFPRMIEQELRKSLNDFGEILNFSNELSKENHMKSSCRINVSPELIKQFEKWDKWAFTRMMEQDLRLIFNGFGEVLDFGNGIDYAPDEKTFENPIRNFLFFD